MKIYVYAIYFPTSKRLSPYYIGVAENLERRMFQHLNSKYLVGNALQKYEDWVIKVLHTCKTYDEAFRIEIEEIRNFNCVDPNGYNRTRGGEGGDTFSGRKHSKETIEKMRGERPKMKELQNAKGHKHTKETIEKIKRNHVDVRGENNSAYGKHWKWSKESIEKIQGNQNAKGHKHSKKQLEANKGNQYAKGKNLRLNNPMNRLDVKIKRLKTRIKKLEKDI